MASDPNSGYQLTWEETAAKGIDLRPYFWQIRELTVRLLLDRRYTLWQRVFLLGTFCRRLEAFSRGEINRRFVDILDDFSRAVETGGLAEAMETITPDLALQLQIVLSMVAQRINGNRISSRSRQVLAMFVRGLRHTRTATVETQVARYADAYQRHFTPFFNRHRQMLENLLVNAVFREAFPFGKALTPGAGEPDAAKAFAFLAIQFALIKGLLIGVAGARGSQFGTDDVVMTVQIASRLFEHNPAFLARAYAMLQAKGLADTRGLTMLLRN